MQLLKISKLGWGRPDIYQVSFPISYNNTSSLSGLPHHSEPILPWNNTLPWFILEFLLQPLIVLQYDIYKATTL